MLLDMNMPGLGGIETCRIIRANSEVAIVMLTVPDAEADQVEAPDAGAERLRHQAVQDAGAARSIRAALRRAPAGRPPRFVS